MDFPILYATFQVFLKDTNLRALKIIKLVSCYHLETNITSVRVNDFLPILTRNWVGGKFHPNTRQWQFGKERQTPVTLVSINTPGNVNNTKITRTMSSNRQWSNVVSSVAKNSRNGCYHLNYLYYETRIVALVTEITWEAVTILDFFYLLNMTDLLLRTCILGSYISYTRF